MICTRCGGQVSDTEKFCSHCGEAVNRSELMSVENQIYNEEKREEADKFFCKSCGHEIKDDKDYCEYCGQDIKNEQKKHCTKCGNLLEDKQLFCDKCGQRVSSVSLTKKVSKLRNNFSKKKIIIATISFVALISLIITGINVIPKLATPYETYLAEGDYIKAFERAGTDEKQLVVKENIVAVVCGEAKENLKDSSSFVLREVYVEKGLKNVVIKDQGNNSYGAAVSSYVWYQWDDENKEFRSWGSCTDFEEEEYYSWDDTDDKVEKIANNIVKQHVKDTVSDEKLKLSTEVVDRINGLFKKGKLGNIELLDYAKEMLNKQDDNSKS